MFIQRRSNQPRSGYEEPPQRRANPRSITPGLEGPDHVHPMCMTTKQSDKNTWIASLTGNPTVSEIGSTEAEAVGKLYLNNQDYILNEILQAQRQVEDEEALQSESAQRAQELQDWHNKQHYLAQEVS